MVAVPMATAPVAPARWLTRRQWVTWVVLGGPVLALAIWGIVDNGRLFFTTLLNALTLASLYFLVASGFTLVFGLMRNVNLAHGSLYLVGAYVGWVVGDQTDSWLLAAAAGFITAAVIGLLLQVVVFRRMQGQDLRQTLVTIGLSIMLAASGVNVQRIFTITFALGAGLAGFAGVVGGSALSISPGEDTRYLLASLVVVIVGGMGSIGGAAIGALLIGAAEQFGLAYAPTYSVVFTFVIMVLVLAFRPRGIMGKAA